MGLSSLYNKLPAFLQNCAVSAYGLVRDRRRYGGNYKKQLASVMSSEFYTSEQIRDIQEKELKELLKIANTSVYYKKLFDSLEVSVENDDPFEILSKLPILAKDQLRGHEEEFYTDAAKGALNMHTSGSTGTPLNIKMSKECLRLRMALLERQRLRFGVTRRSRQLTFVGKKITSAWSKTFWRYNIFGHQMVMSVYDLSEKNREKYLKAITKYDPEVVEGYPSALSVIAEWLCEKKISLSVKCVFATAETLSEEQRDIISRGFGCPVVNYYGSTEGATMITQCECGSLHVDDECGIIEFVRDDGSPAACGENARMLITSFTTKATPLIRYDIGDMAVLSEKECSCGRCRAVVSEIVGRVDDVFVTAEKGKVGRMSTALKLLPSHVRRAQIQQNSPSDFLLLLESDKEVEASALKLVLDDMTDKLGKVNISVEYTEHIPNGKNGKFRTQINHCK